MADSGAKSGFRGILEGIKGKFKEATQEAHESR